jgi:transcriptional regulator with XRE-family HTH domain
LREARGYTQEDLSTRCRLHKSYIGNIERATVNITLASLEVLAAGLECSEEELLSRKAAPSDPILACTPKLQPPLRHDP